MSSIRYIPLGHRCHIAEILKINKLRHEALPFDSIIYSFEGVIDCLQNNFINFFPKKIICEYVFVGTSHPEADSNGNRKLFRGKYGCFTHHDLNNELIITQFKKRIQRFNEYLSVTNDEVIFFRTVMEEGEIDLLNKFINSVKTHYPELKFKIFLIYDNKHIPEVILKYNEYAYIVNSIMTTLDQNSKTNPISYYYLFNYLKNITILNDIKVNDLFNNTCIIFKNDYYKGYAITNLLPYDLNN
jgi:hypothetical protein